jgi:hypothetical protein
MAEDRRALVFHRRWRIQLGEKENFARFQAKIVTSLRAFFEETPTGLTGDSLLEYSIRSGFEYRPWMGEDALAEDLLQRLGRIESVESLVLELHYFFDAIDSLSVSAYQEIPFRIVFRELKTRIKTAVDSSPGIGIEMVIGNSGEVDFLPQGLPLIDEKVNSNLEWLAEHPDSLKEYRQALRLIAENDSSHYRNAMDSLRLAFELLLRHILGTNSPLEKQDTSLQSWLKTHDVQPAVRKTFAAMVTYFTSYQNDEVKHNSPEHSIYELEYIVYAATILMRFVLQLHRASKPQA